MMLQVVRRSLYSEGGSWGRVRPTNADADACPDERLRFEGGDKGDPVASAGNGRNA